MKTATTILIALSLGAALASAPASAETIEAPPEINAAAKAAAAIAREVVMFGNGCYYAIAFGASDRSNCEKFGKAYDAMSDQVMIYDEWIGSIDSRYTSIKWNSPTAEVQKAIDMATSINRVSEY